MVEVVDIQATRTSEEHLKYLKLQEDLRTQKILMRRRYDCRLDIDDFVRQILNIDILDKF